MTKTKMNEWDTLQLKLEKTAHADWVNLAEKTHARFYYLDGEDAYFAWHKHFLLESMTEFMRIYPNAEDFLIQILEKAKSKASTR